MDNSDRPVVSSFFLRTFSAQTHLIGAILATIGLIALLTYGAFEIGDRFFWTCLVFGVTSILVFSASATYHFLTDGFRISPRWHQFFEDIDHSAIYLFIAGSYTALVTKVIDSPTREYLLLSVWAVAFFGIIYTHIKSVSPKSLPTWMLHRYFYTGIFVLMGWMIVPEVGALLDRLSYSQFFLLVLGGAFYSVGSVVYATKRPRFKNQVFGFHEIWHLTVLGGFVCHYFLVLDLYI